MRDEQHILEEWLQHYLDLGFERVVIFDDKSSPPVGHTLRAHSGDPRLKVISSHTDDQVHAFSDGLRRYAQDCDWVLLCDADEFLWTDGRSVADHLSTFGPEVGTVLVSWLVFGTSYISCMDRLRPVREQFILREKFSSGWNTWVKSFVRPGLKALRVGVHVSAAPTTHTIRLATGEEVFLDAPPQDKNQPTLVSERVVNLDISSAPVLLVHYMTLDFENMARKRLRNRNLQDIKDRYSPEWYQVFFEDAEFDDRMHRYIHPPVPHTKTCT